MSLTAKQKHELKKLFNELSSHRGSHTELVTVYVPAGYDIIKIIQHLSQEQGTAVNIKSTSTRKNVIDALEKMIQHLRLYKQTPPNGLMAFSGNVAEREGQSDVKVWSIEPPVPLQMRLYRCDKVFVLDALSDMLEEKEVYGLVVIDGRDATLALLKGKSIIPLLKTHSEVPGKMKAGGQSAMRFQRNADLAALAHRKKVANYITEQFYNKPEIKGILLGGPGHTKYKLIDELNEQLKKKIISIQDLSYTDEFGLQELVERSQDVLAAEEVAKEKKIMNKFFELLSKNDKIVSYGKNETKKFLEMGAVDVLLISESLPDSEIEELEEMAKKFGTTVEIISVETREGAQLRDIGGVAAILRYEVNI
ncbi:MAG: peptide chain release factor aRF-1 [Candidatus Woesearchaeota archaeon]